MKKNKLFTKRLKRVRGAVKRNPLRNRLSVFRSNKHIYAQINEGKTGVTLFSVGDIDSKEKNKKKIIKMDSAFSVGEKIAAKALKKGIKEVVFDRSGYKYHGRVKAVADGARKGGLNF